MEVEVFNTRFVSCDWTRRNCEAGSVSVELCEASTEVSSVLFKALC